MAGDEMELALAIRELVRRVDVYRGERAAAIGGVAVTDIVALGHLFVDGPQSPTELSGRLRVTTASVTELVDRLEHRGWISRAPHPHDRRRILVSLTDTGRTLITEAYRDLGARLAPAFTGLSRTEQLAVMSFLRLAAQALNGSY
ncbi:MarR family transcriptional regulator [Nocardia cyriacigeorgica]|uniref:MarR family transcriptional regulator n=1 Tax=Nocardia cyriacigeorgica TaxID=135487 RepID=A0A6P1DDP0_9NOCA|nr:MarR family transcriptional regulator [Nocardia cyriacigeorgica]NEW38344.1 MarR family transcriptional regulator [Nocardia cyriacigeorgica]NEW46910.1 MarR family transcriptional regulator [Nocardia cyriacigeorgica]NEW49287.1 MarR family transcriptional regulator [Nocardia cyriacigeorgica]NEW54226.1 MarR family transcriptional regulator [Nocardia cyriacigeorgica]